MNAVTLGPAGTYSHRAARAVAAEVSFRESVTAIVDAVESGEFERGVVPIENSIEGSVTESLDALADHDVAVTREVVTPIRHALLAQGPEFEVVASHSQALAQCRNWLDDHYPAAGLEAVASTARGVERAREDARIAGIGHPDPARDRRLVGDDQLYGPVGAVDIDLVYQSLDDPHASGLVAVNTADHGNPGPPRPTLDQLHV